MNAIAFHDVKKRFPKSNFTLSLPSLTAPEGYATGFIGENGAGKTTAIKLMMGLLTPDMGALSLLGQSIAQPQLAAAARREIGYIGETTGYLDTARLEQLTQMVRPFYPSWDQVAFERYMRQFSLDPKKKHKALSKGQQKQFSLVMALAHHPRLLILDEPTANLDPLVRDDILALLSELMAQESLTVFFSSHITSDLDKIADYLRFLHGGQLLLEGEKDTLLERHRVVKTRCELLSDELRAQLINCEKGEFGLCGLTEHPEAVYALLGDEAIYEKPSVEEIFIGYTKRERSRVSCTQ